MRRLFLLVEHVVGIVVHHEEAGIDHALADDGDVVEHILGGLHAGGGGDVAAELGSDALEILEHLLAGKVLEAVEAHVLQEVGETVLVRGLLDGSDMGCKIELGPLGGLVVVTDVVSHTVVELADAGRGIVGKRRLCASGKNGSEKQRENDYESFHIKTQLILLQI